MRLQTLDPLAHLTAKTLPSSGVCRGNLCLGYLRLLAFVVLGFSLTSTITAPNSNRSYSQVFPSFVQGTSLLLLQPYINFAFLHLNISSFIMDSHSYSF